MGQLLDELAPLVIGGLTAVLTLAASAHVVLHKRDVRAAVGWVGVIWIAPLIGAIAYVLLGINRIRRRATSMRSGAGLPARQPGRRSETDTALREMLPRRSAHLTALTRLVDEVTDRPVAFGNRVTPLVDGDEAYPEMLSAIEQATASVALSTYIFDVDRAGRMFADALEQAVRRGVEVRVLIDDVGARYSFPASMVSMLRRRGVPVGRFVPSLMPWRMPYANLRNHRKILLVDGRTGFTGGINIREGHLLRLAPKHPVRDLHFRIEGPVVAHLQQAFAEDWLFTRRELLQGPRWFPPLEPVGPVAARGITDGPDEDFEKVQWTMLGALASARSSIRVVTPYFLPDSSLITALNVAALRGVRVQILVPARNNLALVQWACDAMLWQVVERGCRVHLSPPPFDHSKLLLVDGTWCLIGSANWDPRSLRLNFELNLECYDAALARTLDGWFEERLRASRELTMEEIESRKLPRRLRDGVARLFSPYL